MKFQCQTGRFWLFKVYKPENICIASFGLSLKQGTGNPGIRESGNRGIRESGNPGIRESGNPGIGESDKKLFFIF